MITLYLIIGLFITINVLCEDPPKLSEWYLIFILPPVWPLVVVGIAKLEHEKTAQLYRGAYDRLKKKNGLEKNKPSTILTQMLCAEILKDLKLPKEFRGKKLKVENYKYQKYNEQTGFKYIKSYTLDGYDFTKEECIYINKVLEKAEKLRIKKDENDREAARQHKALDLICGTSMKPLIDESQEKLTTGMLSTSWIILEDGRIPAIFQDLGGTQTAYQLLKEGGMILGKTWKTLSKNDKNQIQKAHLSQKTLLATSQTQNHYTHTLV